MGGEGVRATLRVQGVTRRRRLVERGEDASDAKTTTRCNANCLSSNTGTRARRVGFAARRRIPPLVSERSGCGRSDRGRFPSLWFRSSLVRVFVVAHAGVAMQPRSRTHPNVARVTSLLFPSAHWNAHPRDSASAPRPQPFRGEGGAGEGVSRQSVGGWALARTGDVALARGVRWTHRRRTARRRDRRCLCDTS